MSARSEYMKTWLNKHPGRKRDYRLRSEYGITLADYQRMVEEQKGVCAICGQAPRGENDNDRVLHVDHNHTTGKIRGLLCAPCNKALGLLGDSIDRLHKAIGYLEECDE